MVLHYCFLGFGERVAQTTKGCDFRRGVVSLFPILDWLYNYRWKSDIFNDLISGTTVSIMHIPHGKIKAENFFLTKIVAYRNKM